MRKRVYRVNVRYTFDRCFDVVAESKPKAKRKVLEPRGHNDDLDAVSTLVEDQIDLLFGRKPKEEVLSIEEVSNVALDGHGN